MGSYAKNLNTYKEQSISTMTNIEMLTTTYNQLIKHLNRLKICVSKNEDKLIDTEISRAREVLQYIINTVDKKYEVSSNLLKLYEYMQYQIARFSVTKNCDYIDEVINMVSELRDTFMLANKNLASSHNKE